MKKKLYLYKKKNTKNSTFLLSSPEYNSLNNFYYQNHPWNDKKKYYKDYLYISGLEQKLTNKISKLYETNLNFKKKIKFWKIILFPWLYYFLSFIRSRYLLVDEIYKKRGKFNILLPQYDLNEWIPRDLKEFISFIKNEDFSTIVYSELIKRKLEYTLDNYKINKISIENQISHKSRKIKLFNFFKKNNAKNLINETYLNYHSHKFLNKNIKFQDDFQDLFGKKFKLDRNLLFKNFLNKNANDFENTLKIFFKIFLPTSICENLFLIKKKNFHKNIISGTQIIQDDDFRKFVSYNVDEGSNLYIIQHGGAYGYLKFNSFETRERNMSNFVSWNKHSNNLSATKFFNRKLINKPISQKIIFFGQNYSFKVNHFSEGPYPPKLNYKFQIEQSNTVKLISKKTKYKLFIKTPNFKIKEKNNLLLNHTKKYSNFIPSNKKIDKILKDFRFGITLDPGTIFLECLALNYPCFLILNNFWHFKSNFTKDLITLKRLNIVFEDKKKFIKFIRNIEIQNFWENVCKNQKFIRFKNKYCYYNESKYLNEWKNFLNFN